MAMTDFEQRRYVELRIDTAYPGVWLLKLRLLISPLEKISILQIYMLDSSNHIHIWKMSPQLRRYLLNMNVICHG